MKREIIFKAIKQDNNFRKLFKEVCNIEVLNSDDKRFALISKNRFEAISDLEIVDLIKKYLYGQYLYIWSGYNVYSCNYVATVSQEFDDELTVTAQWEELAVIRLFNKLIENGTVK